MKAIIFLENIINAMNGFLLKIALSATIIMMLLVCADVILRYFRIPIVGSNDIISILLSIVIFFSMGHVYACNRHTKVTILISRFSNRIQAMTAVVTNIIGLCVFILLVWQSYAFGNRLATTGEVSMTLGMPLHPFLYCMAVGCFIMCLVIIVEIFKSIQKAVQ